MSTPDNRKDGTKGEASTATLWIGVGVVFGLLALAWAAMFFFANKHRPADVPIEHQEAR